MEAHVQIGDPRTAQIVPDLAPMNAVLVGIDQAIERTEQLASHLEERLGQVLREAMPLSSDRLTGPRYGVPYADSIVAREERLAMANERIGMVLDRLGL